MDLPKAKRSLKAYKGHLTKATINGENLLGQQVDIAELETSIKSLETRWTKYDQAYDIVESLLLEATSSEASDEEIDTLQTEYYQLQTNCQQILSKLRVLIKNTSQTTTNCTSPVQVSSRPKLPSIQLPTFAGDCIEFESFIDQFEAQIGSRPDLEPVTKLQYLKAQVKGRALELIKGYSSISANYKSALDTLKETYGDEEKIKHSLLQKMINVECPKHTKNDLEAFRIGMLNLTRSLKNKEDYSSCEWLIASIFQHKLTPTTIRQLYFKYEQNYFNLEQLDEGLRDLISHMDVESKQKANPYKSDGCDRSKEKYMGTYYSTNEVNTSTESSTLNTCRFCKGKHKESQCTKYNTGNDRIQRLKELNLCGKCMGKHQTKDCAVRLQRCRRCQKGWHHTILCKTFDYDRLNGTETGRPHSNNSQLNRRISTNKTEQSSVTTGATTIKPNSVALATAIAECGQTGEKIRVFFDSGSQRSFITSRLAQKGGLPVKSKENMTLTGFMGQPQTRDYEIVKPTIKMGKRMKRVTALVVEELPNAIVTVGLTEVVKHLHSKGIYLADTSVTEDKAGPIDVLIGADHYYDFIHATATVVDGIRLLNTPSGYIIFGKIPGRFASSIPDLGTAENYQESVVVMKVTETLDPLGDMEDQSESAPLYKLWDLDVIGITPKQPPPEDQASYQEYLNTVKYENGQYWVKLPWKLNKPHLPDNYNIARGQLHSLVKELEKKGQVDNYHDIIKDQLEQNFIEEVPKNQHDMAEYSHYIPHHAVIKESKTTPLRIVYNCSSKASSHVPSLNDCLMTGPSLTKKLGDVLLTFRTNRYAFTADISKAFLRIGLQEADRDYTRFLWPANPLNLNSQINTYRFKSVLFGATSSPFLLQATIDYHLKNSSSPLKDVLSTKFYVDNFQGSTSDGNFLMQIYGEANKEMRLANMPLRQWTTNHPGLAQLIEQDFEGYQLPSETTILGLRWNVDNDTLQLKETQFLQDNERPLTKRRLLSEVSRLFDPLGIFTPVAIRGKMLLQESWKGKEGWDDILPDHYSENWSQLKIEYEQLPQIKVPRNVINEGDTCTVHVFCDASTSAYGAVAYIVAERAVLLTSKARVAPIRNRTIPQLELTALLVGTRLATYIKQTLSGIAIAETYIWSDSEAALHWIRNDNSKLPYVQNRVREIKEINDSYNFMKVNTKDNPADLLSRGISAKQLKKSALWFQGPEWLKQKDQWPEQMYITPTNASCSQIIQTETNQREGESSIHEIIDIKQYSSLQKLLNVSSYVFKFIKNIYRRKGWTCQTNLDSPTLVWIKQIQSDFYPNEISVLSGNVSDCNTAELSTKTLSSSNASKALRQRLINQLGLFLGEDSVLRCRGRLHNSDLKYGSKHPVLLPKQHWLTKLVIQDAHYNTLHGGVGDTLMNVRKSFWIPKARQAIKSCINQCVICRRYDARPMKYPGPPPLPRERVQEGKPFEVVGVDYSGAIHLKDRSDDEPTKVYICLFTCATTRAVHLDLALDMTASTFLRLFRRFTARRSCPKLVISDNGSNFRAAEAVLKEWFKLDEVQQFFNARRCEWRFIPPKAAWQGGFYERMIGVVKRCLRKVVHNKRVSVDELRTFLTEVEARINNRPLTYIQESINEPEALTPNHLLQGTTVDYMPPVLSKEHKMDPDYLTRIGNTTAKELTERFNTINKLLKTWQRLWRQDYLLSLREHFYGSGSIISPNLKEGDIVIIDIDAPRSTWPLGKIISLLPDRDGNLRIVKVLSKGMISLRTVDRLIPLEISSDNEVGREGLSGNHNVRPQRVAAQEARKRWQNKE